MSRTLELPDAVYAALERLAAASGVPPAAWVAAQVATLTPVDASAQAETGTLADRLAEFIGCVAGENQPRPGESPDDAFTEYLLEKRRAGRL